MASLQLLCETGMTMLTEEQEQHLEGNTPEPQVIWDMVHGGCFGIRLRVATETHLCFVVLYVRVDSGMWQHSTPLPQGYLQLYHSGFSGKSGTLWVRLSPLRSTVCKSFPSRYKDDLISSCTFLQCCSSCKNIESPTLYLVLSSLK